MREKLLMSRKENIENCESRGGGGKTFFYAGTGKERDVRLGSQVLCSSLRWTGRRSEVLILKRVECLVKNANSLFSAIPTYECIKKKKLYYFLDQDGRLNKNLWTIECVKKH